MKIKLLLLLLVQAPIVLAQHLKVDEAIYGDTHPTEGIFTYYKLSLSSVTNDSITVTKAWICGKRFYIVGKDNFQIYQKQNKFAFYLHARTIDKRSELHKQLQASYTPKQLASFKPPFKYKGIALIEYTINKSTKKLYFRIPIFKLESCCTDLPHMDPTAEIDLFGALGQYIYTQQ